MFQSCFDIFEKVFFLLFILLEKENTFLFPIDDFSFL